MENVDARPQPALAARRALVPLALMGLIFVLSAQPDVDSGLGALDLILRKLAHMTEYALLTILWAWVLRPVIDRNLIAAALIAVLYAATDEYHQTFVEGRHGTPVDVLIDSIGVMIALLVLRYHRRIPVSRERRGVWRGP